MTTSWGEQVSYQLADLAVHDLLGQKIQIRFTGNIYCIECGRKTKKSFNQGYCFPCFQKLACCDVCIVRPALCHYHEGTCREPEWGQSHCLIEHVVYLANTTQAKVGVTGAHKVHERWADQGATSALVIARLSERRLAGLIEMKLQSFMPDKTDWRGLICGRFSEADLLIEQARVRDFLSGEPEIKILSVDQLHVEKTCYPALRFPAKAVSLSLDKQNVIESELIAIRGQYLIFDVGGLNIRKHQGYEVNIQVC